MSPTDAWNGTAKRLKIATEALRRIEGMATSRRLVDDRYLREVLVEIEAEARKARDAALAIHADRPGP